MDLPVINRLSTALHKRSVVREFGIESLVKVLDEYLPEDQIADVRRAYEFGAKHHAGQNRSSGEPYIYHPLAVARILAEMRMDATTLMAAILHDVIEDTEVSKDRVAMVFGKDVADLVEGVTKIGKVEGLSRAELQAESFRKLLLAMTHDLRVILVKLADRLHNMRTLGATEPEKRIRVAKETLQIYAPIAQRLGIHTIRTQLEDLAFANMHPERHRVLERAIDDQIGDSKNLIKGVESKIAKALREEGIGATVVGREKNIYSIYQKMRRKKMRLLQVMDLLGFRIIVAKVDDCYRALGVVHHVYKPVPGGFDDYIANSKANGYQSLHTTCIGPEGHKIEVQIRTREMHHIADSGIAAHWQYKMGSKDGVSSAPQVRANEWLRGLFDELGTAGSLEFIEGVKVDLFPDEVYVFTPKGLIRRMPKGATSVDFAYSVHSELGDRCVAARIDGSLEPLNTPLRSGQTVEIITARHARPNAAWLNFVKTAKARSHIRNFLRNQREDEAVRLGRRLIEIAMRDLGVPLGKLREEAAEPVLKAYGLKDMEELYAAIGTGERLAPLVARHFLPDQNSSKSDTSTAAPLAIEGTEGLVVDYARCCRPIPGDDIRGNVSVGRGIVIHRIDCKHAKARPQDWVPLIWADQVLGDYLSEIRVHALNQRGLLARVTAEITSSESSIENVQMPDRAGGETIEIRFIITVKSRVHLAHVMRRLHRLDGVEKVVRT
ncbi:MAG: bifunctional (p)ppGpp synthetase/guanosine-3,5-bis(diphosphate) 3-pyrophosphohydrolase [Hydrocarboniphaga sp.]|uniref:RelA/SpoT family protein n=1 Tax=Hydrocarboniphaga sp. TaxID=2033016 RepID=UPI00260CE29D|nr:bifunctional (p)ppGpp synthetase/guanosine-3',5'-bis(diphosphate) 3'-pyrophosphohydrolase [Hydrocarboniphaga sp.]MDB5972855.1 bifunctional (p)ppGpp synthetase/guanosine-3,5-bis(diphosphate) 3-pyrophosphohydrolase [Hydrocarboniphaga sp.]